MVLSLSYLFSMKFVKLDDTSLGDFLVGLTSLFVFFSFLPGIALLLLDRGSCFSGTVLLNNIYLRAVSIG